MTVGGLLLAAGAGRRLGTPKALVRLGGELLVERGFRLLLDGGCDPVVVVVGAAADTVRAEADLAGALVVDNHDWASGMASSLRAGLDALAATPAVAALVALVDQPFVGTAAVARLVALADVDAVAVATYRGVGGHPVLLGRETWGEAARVATGDRGARDFLSTAGDRVRRIPCDGTGDPDDLDTPAAFAAAADRLRTEPSWS